MKRPSYKKMQAGRKKVSRLQRVLTKHMRVIRGIDRQFEATFVAILGQDVWLLESTHDEVRACLRRDDPELRKKALYVLDHRWLGDESHGSLFESILHGDPSDGVREVAAFCLGRLHTETRDPGICGILAPLVRRENEAFPVRAAAYFALLSVLGAPGPDPRPPLDFSENGNVDWKLVDKFCGSST